MHPYPDNLVIATKGGFVRSGPEYADMGAVGNRHYLRQAAYMSARRLGLDHGRATLDETVALPMEGGVSCPAADTIAADEQHQRGHAAPISALA